MATQLIEAGFWPCTVLSAACGQNDRDEVVARINVRIDDGPSKGRTCSYEDAVNSRSNLYIARSCKAVGWRGETLTTLADDCAKWIAETGGKSTVEIKHIPTKSGRIWDKANSIGRGPKPLVEPSARAKADADALLREAIALDGGGAPDGTPADDDGIPFVTCSMSATLGEIAAVLK